MQILAERVAAHVALSVPCTALIIRPVCLCAYTAMPVNGPGSAASRLFPQHSTVRSVYAAHHSVPPIRLFIHSPPHGTRCVRHLKPPSTAAKLERRTDLREGDGVWTYRYYPRAFTEVSPCPLSIRRGHIRRGSVILLQGACPFRCRRRVEVW